MNPCKRFCDDTFDSEIHRCQCSMFSTRPLTIVFASNNKATMFFLGSFCKVRVNPIEHVLTYRRHITPKRQYLSSSRHYSVSADIVSYSYHHTRRPPAPHTPPSAAT